MSAFVVLSLYLSRIKLLDYYLRQTLIKKINPTMELPGILNMEADFWA